MNKSKGRSEYDTPDMRVYFDTEINTILDKLRGYKIEVEQKPEDLDPAVCSVCNLVIDDDHKLMNCE